MVRHYVDSYESVHQGEQLLLLRDREPLPKELAEELEPQARDLGIIRALWRYRFLLTSQIAREWLDCPRFERHLTAGVERLRLEVSNAENQTAVPTRVQA